MKRVTNTFSHLTAVEDACTMNWLHLHLLPLCTTVVTEGECAAAITVQVFLRLVT